MGTVLHRSGIQFSSNFPKHNSIQRLRRHSDGIPHNTRMLIPNTKNATHGRKKRHQPNHNRAAPPKRAWKSADSLHITIPRIRNSILSMVCSAAIRNDTHHIQSAGKHNTMHKLRNDTRMHDRHADRRSINIQQDIPEQHKSAGIHPDICILLRSRSSIHTCVERSSSRNSHRHIRKKQRKHSSSKHRTDINSILLLNILHRRIKIHDTRHI